MKHFRPYLYGHPSEVYTDHGALKFPPQPSGKLARWGMAIQELDIHILHCAGHTNGNADALSRCPVGNDEFPDHSPYGIISTIIPDEGDALKLAELQRADNSLTAIIEYLETGILPRRRENVQDITVNSDPVHAGRRCVVPC